jgi:hypothetical protein
LPQLVPTSVAELPLPMLFIMPPLLWGTRNRAPSLAGHPGFLGEQLEAIGVLRVRAAVRMPTMVQMIRLPVMILVCRLPPLEVVRIVSASTPLISRT